MLLAPAHGTKIQGEILALVKAKLPLGRPGGLAAAERGSVGRELALEQSRALSRPVPSLLFVQDEPGDPCQAFKAAEESISSHYRCSWGFKRPFPPPCGHRSIRAGSGPCRWLHRAEAEQEAKQTHGESLFMQMILTIQ